MRTLRSATSPHELQPLSIVLYTCGHTKIEQYCEELERHLAPLKRQGRLVTQQSHTILVGSVRKEEIMSRVDAADMLVFPLSAWLFGSDEYWATMEHARQLFDQGKVHVVPVRVSPGDYDATCLRGLQVLPWGRKSLSQLSNPDREAAFATIAEDIRGLINKLQVCAQPEENVAEVLEIEEQVDNPAFYKAYGDFLSQHQKYTQAMVAYNRAISLDPHFEEAYAARAELRKMLAILNYEKMKQLSNLFDDTQGASNDER